MQQSTQKSDVLTEQRKPTHVKQRPSLFILTLKASSSSFRPKNHTHHTVAVLRFIGSFEVMLVHRVHFHLNVDLRNYGESKSPKKPNYRRDKQVERKVERQKGAITFEDVGGNGGCEMQLKRQRNTRAHRHSCVVQKESNERKVNTRPKVMRSERARLIRSECRPTKQSKAWGFDLLNETKTTRS